MSATEAQLEYLQNSERQRAARLLSGVSDDELELMVCSVATHGLVHPFLAEPLGMERIAALVYGSLLAELRRRLGYAEMEG